MTIKELKAIIRKLDKNTVVKVNGKDSRDIKIEISVNQDGQWFINLIENKGNSTTPAASGDSPALDGERSSLGRSIEGN